MFPKIITLKQRIRRNSKGEADLVKAIGWKIKFSRVRVNSTKTHQFYFDSSNLFRLTYKRPDMEIDPIFGTPPHNHTVLWNAMIHPLLNMTIYGAIWYQGETLSHRIRYLLLYRLNERCSYPSWRCRHLIALQVGPTSRVPVEGKSSVRLICMIYRITRALLRLERTMNLLCH